jgi:hypothetical protein
MKIDQTHGSTIADAALHKVVEDGESCSIECAVEIVVQQELPADWNTEGIEPSVSHEMLHLVNASLAWSCCAGDGTVARGVATEVKTGNVDSGILDDLGGAGL